ncbi:endonuclease/exonuclease/phosphatase family protein [Parabacteroides sp. Marseille-P3160]|mgnify:CR=1 FL=1|uniref:endonuclease/exonuclease/phosphatase family protein n=1 Tax=Parabacteroides sp. Marseille-P3160 TaxID=1917887 RepID=UPI0009BB1C48|nr:endonuclease/exonuclease/phosphatase family protein [Parabacteroides sp. Marseille-P3160]
MNFFRLIVHSLVASVHLFFLLLMMAAAYSDHFSPEKSLLMAYLGLGFPILCFINFCFLIYWIFLSQWKMLAAGICGFLICLFPLMSYFPIHLKTKEIPKEDVIKVLTYNVMAFGYKTHTANSPNPIVEYIAQSDADIVCMQEYLVAKSGNFLTNKKLQRALHMYPYRSLIPLATVNRNQSIGLAVYSKYPINRSRRIKYKSPFNGSSIHELNVKGRTVYLVNNHLESFKLTMEDRSKYSNFIKNLSSDTFDAFKGSVHQKLGPAYRTRAVQAETVADEIGKLGEEQYIIVCGDFNDTPISYAHRTVLGNLTDAFAESGCGPGITYNQNLFWFRIDHIFHSANMSSINCTVDKIKYSDHYPLWCYLKFNQ